MLKKFFNHFKKFIFVILLTILSACQFGPEGTFPASRAFYVNDQAEVLLSSSRFFIYSYSTDLYEDSLDEKYKNQQIDGAQVVFATYNGFPGEIDSTKLFNHWKIGKNDMGLLIILFFTPGIGDEGATYNGMNINIGSKLSGYLSASHAEQIAQETFDDLPTIKGLLQAEMYDTVLISDNNYDFRMMSFYYGLMEFIYLNIYDYNSYDYMSFIVQYYNNQYNSFVDKMPKEGGILSLPVWIIIGVIVLLILFGGGRFIWPLIYSLIGGNSGGGGKSRGYQYTRK